MTILEKMTPRRKQTEVGTIPADWNVVEASKVCEIVVDCKNRTPPVVDGGNFAVVRTPNVRDGKFVRDDLRFTDENSFKEWTARATPRAGDVLITREAPLGEVCLAPSDIQICLGQRMMLYRPDPTKADNVYLLYSLMSSAVQRNLLNKIGGSTVGHAKVSDIRDLLIPIPPTLAEQRAIAAALSDADALIAKKRDLKQAAMQQLLTGKTRLPGFTGEWSERSLFELAGKKKELFDDGDWIESEHITDKGIRLIQTGNIGLGKFVEKTEKKYIFDSSFNSLQCKEIRAGDLLICRLAEPAGRACVLPAIGENKIVTSVDVTIFRPPTDIADRVFLANLFSTDQWFRTVGDRSGGTTHKRISRGTLGRIRISIPPVDEQAAIATILADMDADIAAVEAKRDKARALKQGMMQKLLTGRIRLT